MSRFLSAEGLCAAAAEQNLKIPNADNRRQEAKQVRRSFVMLAIVGKSMPPLEGALELDWTVFPALCAGLISQRTAQARHGGQRSLLFDVLLDTQSVAAASKIQRRNRVRYRRILWRKPAPPKSSPPKLRNTLFVGAVLCQERLFYSRAAQSGRASPDKNYAAHDPRRLIAERRQPKTNILTNNILTNLRARSVV